MKGNAQMVIQMPSDIERFEMVYKEHFKGIFNYICFRIGNPTDAEDLAADVFVRAFERLGSFDSEKGEMRAWIGGIARNVVNTYLRKIMSKPKVVELSELLSADIDIEEDYLHTETLRHLLSLVKLLPQEKQELLAMKYMLRLTNREIADALGKSEGAVKMAIHRIIEGLEKKMSE